MRKLAVVVVTIGVLVAGIQLLGRTPAQGQSPPAAGGPGAGASRGPALPVETGVAAVRDIRRVLEVAGSLKTDEDIDIGSRLEGRVDAVSVTEGVSVEAGQVLVRLDGRDLAAQLARSRAALRAAEVRLSSARNLAGWKDTSSQSEHARATAAVTTAKARLEHSQTNLKLVETEVRLKVETAQSGVRVATERLSIARDLTRKQELRQAQFTVAQARAELTAAEVEEQNATQVLTRRRKLFEQDALPREDVEEAERRQKTAAARVKVAATAVDVAVQKLDLAEEGSRAEEVRIAEGQLRAAERNLELATSDLQRKKLAEEDLATAQAGLAQAEAAEAAAKAGLVQARLSEDDIRAAEAAIAQAKAEVQLYESQQEDLVIRAPVAGVVSRRWVSPGEVVTRSSRLLTLVAVEKLYLEAVLPESDVSVVRPGLRGTVTVDALGDSRLETVVREVIPIADPTSRSYRVRLSVLAGGRRLPVNAFARGELTLGLRRKVVAVPRAAVFTEGGDTFVWTVDASGEPPVARRRAVHTGARDTESVEIVSGLKTGEAIILSASPALVDESPVTMGAGK